VSGEEALRSGEVHDAVPDNRRGLLFAIIGKFSFPGHAQGANIGFVNLRQTCVTVSGVCLGRHDPVGVVVLGVQQGFGGDCARRQRRDKLPARCQGSCGCANLLIVGSNHDEKIAFLRNLYRNESAYSDDVRITRLRELNVKTSLDEVIRKIVRAGGSVVITGNAGDGKTHTIRLLEGSLKEANADVIKDASEHSHEEILTKWCEARTRGRPFCIAINEGLLVDLIRAHKSSHPWLDDLQRELFNLVRYVPVEEPVSDSFRPGPGKTVVIDLSLRSTLSADLLLIRGNNCFTRTFPAWMPYSWCSWCWLTAGRSVNSFSSSRIQRLLTSKPRRRCGDGAGKAISAP